MNVYWTEFSDGNNTGATGSVKKCSISGCGKQPTIIAAGLNGTTALALDATNIYWAEYGTGANDGRIVRAPK